jgi:hypothetical protein
LKHIFDNDYGITQNSTDNLMDYSDGTNLIFYQWNQVHDPGHVWGLFEKDDDAQKQLIIHPLIQAIKKSFSEGKMVDLTLSVSLNTVTIAQLKLDTTNYGRVTMVFSDYELNIKSVQALAIEKHPNVSVNIRVRLRTNSDTILVTLTLDNERERDLMYQYLIAEKEIVDRIQWALDSVSKYITITTYKQEQGTLRTGTTAAALQYMDCAEFATRFLQLACELEQIPQFTTGDLAPSAVSGGIYGNYLQFVSGSNGDGHTDIRPGDIFLWRTTDNGGHVGVVESYTEPYVYVLEALTTSCEASLNTGTCTNCVRRSKYTKTGNALLKHGDGRDWKGYFRPIINNK